MNYELVCFIILIIGVLCFITGILIGANLCMKDRIIGDLVIVHEDGEEQPYLFLDLMTSTESLKQSKQVALRIRDLPAREKQGA